MSAQPVITIATSTGAGAEETGRLLASNLKLRYINDQIIERAAERAGVSRAELERVEHSRTLVERILQSLAANPLYEEFVFPLDTPPYQDPSSRYQQTIRDVIRQIAEEGGAVIVAHGAGMMLAERPDVLRAFVTASPAVRASRIASERGCSNEEAERIVRKADAERAAFLRRFYGVRHELPQHYDIVINTDAMGPEDAARVLACAAETCQAAAVSAT